MTTLEMMMMIMTAKHHRRRSSECTPTPPSSVIISRRPFSDPHVRRQTYNASYFAFIEKLYNFSSFYTQ